MTNSAKSPGKQGKSLYSKGPVFAVAPMIDGIETAKYSSKNNLGKISVAKS